ncbi:MAG: glycerol dehydrogenase [Nitriliruptoraceae bacterium]
MSDHTAARPKSAVFAAPGRYIQGVGAIDDLPDWLDRLGLHRPLLLVDPVASDILGDRITGLDGAVTETFGGETSPSEIDRITARVGEVEADAVVGIGGGKTIDTAKAVAHPAGTRLVIVPTLASTDAPCSALSVVYNDEGAFLEYRFFERNPDVVIVDTEVVAKAPVRFLVAGIGDALATWFEAESSSLTRAEAMSGGAPTRSALALARLSYDTLLEYGVAARRAVEADAVSYAVEAVVEANTLLSGLGFESGGLAAAHAIHNGLTALHATHDYQHGEKVSFGLASMLVLEDRPNELVDRVYDFCLAVGLPITLADIGLDGVDRADLERVAEAACAPGETIHNEPFPVHPGMVVDAMLAADAYAKERRARATAPLPTPAT